MKANAPKRKVFQDALDLLAEDPVQDTSVAVNGLVSIPVEEIHPFYDHPFRLYEGDHLEDMVQSIRAYGVLNPVIVRKAARGYEMLAGHNRTNAAKIAGLTEVPAIVKTDLSDEDAYVYEVTEDGAKAIKGLEWDEDYEAWTFKTRKLGAYAISDVELDEKTVTEDKDNTTDGGKENPDTGR